MEELWNALHVSEDHVNVNNDIIQIQLQRESEDGFAAIILGCSLWRLNQF